MCVGCRLFIRLPCAFQPCVLVVHLCPVSVVPPCNSDLRLLRLATDAICMQAFKTRQSPVVVMQGCQKDALHNVRMLVRVCVCVCVRVCVCI